jgi:predicted RNA-binding protein associated with RNAse of E/G family
VRGFERGEAVALREIWNGRVFAATPARVVDEQRDRRMFYVAPGTWKAPKGRDGEWLRLPSAEWTLQDREWDGRVLSFSFDGVAAATLLIWNERWEPQHWYLNLETPPVRSPVGIDYTDHALDALVSIDLTTVTWKDEDELEDAVRLGLFTDRDAERFRRDGERAVDRLVNREPPFDRDWTTWRPDPSWTAPKLPDGWDAVGG